MCGKKEGEGMKDKSKVDLQGRKERRKEDLQRVEKENNESKVLEIGTGTRVDQELNNYLPMEYRIIRNMQICTWTAQVWTCGELWPFFKF